MASLSGQQRLASARRIIIKVGSSLLIAPQTSKLRCAWMRHLVTDIADLRARGCEVLLVSSGAVAAGRAMMGVAKKPVKLEEAQALAAIGQLQVASVWAEAFAEKNQNIGQVLLTLADTENRRRWLNCSATLTNLLQMGVIPLINENDSVASDEIRYGDNDRLAARAAQMAGADLLVLLSDVDGLYSDDPSKNPDAEHIALVRQITPEIQAMAGGASSNLGSGGMTTKLLAAKIASAAGCATLIADGRENAPLRALQEQANCTLFLPAMKPAQARKNWIAGTVAPKGNLTIDAGAAKALLQGASLLAAGTIAVDGQFGRGEVVCIQNQQSEELARGMVSYDAKELQSILGLKSQQIADRLGYEARKAVVHRDALALSEPIGK
ncbi:Glutamate 5-kinase / RNA-binding C-terminal domain PUA [hydrothermal vent metagenome]|uniref:Glutamate 5-kinase / RNA-binding C-terminal domain PUA n=1 Tax=hydrothermal vent metagenome TaxID=652676 RepID=A0A3B0R2G1_9ZZZZ